MKMRRMPSHPEFKLEGRSRHFQSFWELELEPGEATSPHQHYESEEIVYLLDGEGRITVARDERTIHQGEVILVPPRTTHTILNPRDSVLRAITVESRFDLGAEGDAETPAVEPASIDRALAGLDADVDEAVAIRKIVELFDIGGRLSEQIEKSLGLESQDGVEALSTVEKKIMQAVLAITARYRSSHGGS